MKFSQDANYTLYWAVIVGFFAVTCLLIATACSTSTIVKECGEPDSNTKRICKTLKPWE